MQEKTIKKNFTKKRRIRKGTLQLYSLIAIPLLHIFVFAYIPMIGVIIAFKNYRYDKGILGSDWVGLDNFKYFFYSGTFGRLLRNTVVSNLVFWTVGLIAAVAVAVMLFRIRSARTVKVVQTLMTTPNFVSWVISAYVVYAVLSPSNGLLNRLLVNLGFEKVDWYSTPEIWPLVLIIATLWKGVGMSALFYYSTLVGIDSSLFEAARIDGASRWQELKHIILPGLKTIIIIMQILNIGSMLSSNFDLFYSVTRDQGALYKYTDVLDTYLYRMTRVVGDLGVSSAVGFMKNLVGMVLVIGSNLVVRKIDPDSALF